MLNKYRVLPLAVAVAACLAIPSAMAAAVSDPMTVSITLTNACSIVADDLTFPASTTLTAALTANADVRVVCSGANPVSIAFSAGDGAGSTIASRHMSQGASTVSYNLYRESAFTTVLGTTAATDTIDFTSTGSGSTDTKVVYGRVPAQAAKPNGTYSSIVTATLTY